MSTLSAVLVTGAGGFVGSRVMRAWPNAVAWPKTDLRDRAAVAATVEMLARSHPFQNVLHMAAMSSPQLSFRDPVGQYEVNLMGTVHLMEALRAQGWRGRFLLVSSCAVYGDPDRVRMPLLESSPLQPMSPYAASKAGAEQAALEWGHRCDIEVLVARPSNHAGPGQTDHYFLASMARQITRVPRGAALSVEVGNLSPCRDFLHVDDVIDAYRSLLQSGQVGPYNVASGQSQPLSSMLEGLIRASGRRVTVEVSPERFREEASQPIEISIERLKKDTGWRPERGLERLYTDLISFWETQE